MVVSENMFSHHSQLEIALSPDGHMECQIRIKYHTDRTIPKSNIKIVEKGKIDTPNIQILISQL